MEILMNHSQSLRIAAAVTITLFVCGCAPISSVTIGMGHPPIVHTESHHHQGPPPHAPAHGYRHKHRQQGQELELQFDSALGVYIVMGIPDRYYWNGFYLQMVGDEWHSSESLHSDYKRRDDESLPPGLRKHKKHPKANRGKSKKHSPARGHW
jgi:hypothetical protein